MANWTRAQWNEGGRRQNHVKEYILGSYTDFFEYLRECGVDAKCHEKEPTIDQYLRLRREHSKLYVAWVAKSKLGIK